MTNTSSKIHIFNESKPNLNQWWQTGSATARHAMGYGKSLEGIGLNVEYHYLDDKNDILELNVNDGDVGIFIRNHNPSSLMAMKEFKRQGGLVIPHCADPHFLNTARTERAKRHQEMYAEVADSIITSSETYRKLLEIHINPPCDVHFIPDVADGFHRPPRIDRVVKGYNGDKPLKLVNGCYPINLGATVRAIPSIIKFAEQNQLDIELTVVTKDPSADHAEVIQENLEQAIGQELPIDQLMRLSTLEEITEEIFDSDRFTLQFNRFEMEGYLEQIDNSDIYIVPGPGLEPFDLSTRPSNNQEFERLWLPSKSNNRVALGTNMGLVVIANDEVRSYDHYQGSAYIAADIGTGLKSLQHDIERNPNRVKRRIEMGQDMIDICQTRGAVASQILMAINDLRRQKGYPTWQETQTPFTNTYINRYSPL